MTGNAAGDAARPTIAFVVGVGRSGSTILDVVLGSDPSIEGVGELVNVARSGWINDEFCACGKRVQSCEYWTAVRADVERTVGSFDPHGYLGLQSEFERARGMWRWWTGPPSEEHRRYGHQTLAIYSAIRRVSGRPVVVDSSKSPVRALALSRVLGPDLRLLHLVRDPRGVAWSLLKPYARDDAAGVQRDIPSRPAWRTSLLWSEVNALSEVAARRFAPERRATIRYEDFLADPARVLDTVGRVLSADLSELGKRVVAGEAMTSGHNGGGEPAPHAGLDSPARRRGVARAPEQPGPGDGPGDRRAADVALRVPVVAVRALLFIGTLETGGAERQFAVLADGLLRDGVDALLCTMTPGGSNWDRLAQTHRDHLVSLEPRAPRGAADAARQHLGAPARLRGVIRRFRPDVVYSALHMSNAIAWIATRGTGTPLAWGLRASEDDLNPKRAAPFQFCRLVSGTVPLAIANARAGRDHHLRRGFRPRRFEVVPNGIDTERFRPDADARAARRSEWGVAADQPVIGTVGRLVAAKGHAVLLEAARDVLGELPDARFVVVGDGPAATRDRLKADAAQLGLDGRVLWLGHRADTASIYPGFDVFCLPSLTEGFPNVVGEAMACGLACVVTDAGDAPLIVGGAGRVVPPGDPVKLAENIIWATEHSADRDGDARRQRIVDAFSVARMVRQTHDLLESLVARSNPS